MKTLHSLNTLEIKNQELTPDYFQTLFDQLKTGLLTFDHRVSFYPFDSFTHIKQDHFILNFLLSYCPNKILEKNKVFFETNKNLPVFESLYFSLTYNCKALGQKIAFLVRTGVNINTVAQVEHCFYIPIENLGLTPLMCYKSPLILRNLLKYGASLTIVGEKVKILSALSTTNPPLNMESPINNGKIYLQELVDKKLISEKIIAVLEKQKLLFNNDFLNSSNQYYYFMKYLSPDGKKDLNAYDKARANKNHGKLKVFQTFLNNQEESLEIKPFYIQQENEYLVLQKLLLENPRKAYRVLVISLRENNLAVLTHLAEFKDLIENYKNKKYHQYDLIFYSIKYNRLNWLEQLFKLNLLPHNTVYNRQTYLEQALQSGQYKISDYLLQNLDFSQFSDTQIKEIHDFSSIYTIKLDRKNKLLNLDKIKESLFLKETLAQQTVKKIKVL